MVHRGCQPGFRRRHPQEPGVAGVFHSALDDRESTEAGIRRGGSRTMTNYEKAKLKRAQELAADDARIAANCLLYLEALWGPLPRYEVANVEMPRLEFLRQAHRIVIKDIRTQQRRERALKRAQRDPAGGEER